MRKSRLRLFLALILAFVSIALLAWGLLPGLRSERTVPIPPADLVLPTAPGG